MRQNKNIAIYGGSFDPVHLGHQEVVKKALKSLDIDRLFIIPTYISPFKTQFFAPPKLRLKWLKKLFKKNKKVKICIHEIKNKKPTPTYESVLHLQKKYDFSKCFLIVGADNLQNLTKWHEYEKLKKLVSFVVATRDDEKISKNLKKLKINVNISSTNLRKQPKKKFISKKIFKSVSKFYNKGRK